MKFSHSLAYFIIILAAAGGIFFFINRSTSSNQKILLQTIDCQSDKLDKSVTNLDSKTSLVGAMISFKEVPISDDLRNKIKNLNISLDENSWIFDYVLAKIPTSSLCELVKDDNVKSIFIPNFN